MQGKDGRVNTNDNQTERCACQSVGTVILIGGLVIVSQYFLLLILNILWLLRWLLLLV